MIMLILLYYFQINILEKKYMALYTDNDKKKDKIYYEFVEMIIHNKIDDFREKIKQSENEFVINYNQLLNEFAVDPLLILSIKMNRELFFDCLIENKANVNIRFNSIGDMTPLHATYFYNNLNIIKKLIELGADVNSIDIWKNTCLFKHVQLKNKETVIFLLKSGANIFGTGTYPFKTLLSEIQSLLGDEFKFVSMGEENSYYRLVD